MIDINKLIIKLTEETENGKITWRNIHSNENPIFRAETEDSLINFWQSNLLGGHISNIVIKNGDNVKSYDRNSLQEDWALWGALHCAINKSIVSQAA